MKVCDSGKGGCGIEKDESELYNCLSTIDGKESICKGCKKEILREYQIKKKMDRIRLGLSVVDYETKIRREKIK